MSKGKTHQLYHSMVRRNKYVSLGANSTTEWRLPSSWYR